MNTSSILRQCLHELEAAHDEAVREHGPDSWQVEMVGDALIWMRAWMEQYALMHTNAASHQPDD